MNVYEAQARLLKAIAHPTRLWILQILGQEESCVCHLTAILRQRQPYISQHLMVLREAGLVADRKDGVIVYYRLSDPAVLELIASSRELLARMGVPVTMPLIPAGPVAGCPCPKCTQGSPCCSS